MSSSSRRSTSLTLDCALLDEAKELGVNISRAAEKGVESDVKAARQKLWKEENSEAIADFNAYIDEHGVPFADLRKF